MPPEWPVIQPTGRHFRLIKLTILKTDLLGTRLSGRLFSVCMPMIENIIISVNLDQASMGISRIILCMIYIRNSGKSYITVADENASVFKTTGRIVTGRIAELMAVQGTINEVISISEFSHRACFQKRMSFIRRSD